MSEWMTVVADYLLAVIMIVLGARLLIRGRRAVEASIMVFGGGFMALALTALATGLAHTFVRQLGGSGLETVWRLSALAIGLASFCLLAGVLLACSCEGWRRFFLGLVAVKLIVFSFWVLSQGADRYVVWEYSGTLVLLALVEGWAGISRQARSAPWIVAGAAALLLAGAIEGGGIAIHPSLEHGVLYDLQQLVGLVLLYRGGWHLHDRLA